MRAAAWLSFHNIRPDLWGRCMHADIANIVHAPCSCPLAPIPEPSELHGSRANPTCHSMQLLEA